MPNYQDGKIYTIRCRTDNALIYVGSTIMTLPRRIAEHRFASVSNNSRKLYQSVNNNWDNWYIELHSLYPCENKQELNKREGEIIREIGTLNCEIAGRTRKEWRADNPDKVKLIAQTYHQNHREERLEALKQYNINNNEARKEYKKKYREEHKAEISAYRKAYYHEVQSTDKDAINKKQNENRAKRLSKNQEDCPTTRAKSEQ
jgi:hypothetical protein